MISANYATLLDSAEAYNLSQPVGADDYDMCGGALGENAYTGTKWTQVYRYNFILYLVLACLSGSALLCIPCAPAMICPTICFACSGIPTLVAFILTGIRLNNSQGDLCAANDTFYNRVEETSFASDAAMMKKLWIASMAI
eukprot:CAMPEP_0170455204 /NCGR_PEP_ID=MMETSP0123-20130129/3235_1 /TAXON_ID=182087 /ORGANISM="Favella ehrenbergii, Strain Fehren 1" /LENGTH=140 /DNA_ID=CAMNT_0010718241 /DNA_START=93 /DNA_END=515 /DNA_ORIENTATION=+